VTDLASGCSVQGDSRAFGGNSRRVPDDASHISDSKRFVSISDEGIFPLRDCSGLLLIVQFIQDSDAPIAVLEPFALIGLLANYNKFEFQNPYQMRLNDFVNESTIQKIIRCVGYTCQGLRLEYVMIQDDLPEGWTLSSTLAMFGLGAIFSRAKTEKKTVYDEDTAKQMFTELYVHPLSLS
jgi:hypothetical protein